MLFDTELLLKQMHLESKDVRLLQLVFSSAVSSTEKADFCKNLEIENEPMEFNLLLARLCHRHGYQGIPPLLEPRIRGTARFYLFKNARLFSSFRDLGRRLNEAGIPILLLKGAALKAAFDGDSSRCLADIDFVVPKERLQEAVKLAQAEGYSVFNKAPHSIDMKQEGLNNGSIDIHYKIFKTSHNRSIEDELAEGAKQVEAFGAKVWVSSPENLLLQLLENEFYNLWIGRENQRRLKWIYDCGSVLSLSRVFDWSRVSMMAKKHCLHDPIRSMLIIFSEVFPDLLPKSILALHFPEEKEAKDPYRNAFLQWNMQRAKRSRLYAEGKKWRALFLRPIQMTAEYRYRKMDGTLESFREFILTHFQVKNYFEFIGLVFRKFYEKVQNS